MIYGLKGIGIANYKIQIIGPLAEGPVGLEMTEVGMALATHDHPSFIGELHVLFWVLEIFREKNPSQSSTSQPSQI